MKPVHPLLLQAVPEISTSDRAKLRAGIQSSGYLIYPIIVSEGQVIDGRTRQELCTELGIEPRYEEYSGTLSTPEYILQCNLRRNLTQDQTDAMILALGRAVIPQMRKEAKEAQIRKSVRRNADGQTKVRRDSVAPANRVDNQTQKRFRKLVGSTDKADAVLSVLNHEDLASAVENKELSLKEAHKTARQRQREKKGEERQLPVFEPEPEPEKINAKIKTGKVAPPEDKVPERIMRQILTPDMVGKGFRTCSDVNGNPCQLSPNVSELEFKERAPFAIAGDETFKARKASAKWDQYDTAGIRSKLLKVLELMSPLDIPAVHNGAPLTYVYNLGVASDLRELAEMVSADLLRAADTLELREKYAHIEWKPID
jgi:hypothetical protein